MILSKNWYLKKKLTHLSIKFFHRGKKFHGDEKFHTTKKNCKTICQTKLCLENARILPVSSKTILHGINIQQIVNKYQRFK